MVMEDIAAATLHVEASFQRPSNNPTEPCGARCLVETAEQVEPNRYRIARTPTFIEAGTEFCKRRGCCGIMGDKAVRRT